MEGIHGGTTIKVPGSHVSVTSRPTFYSPPVNSNQDVSK